MMLLKELRAVRAITSRNARQQALAHVYKNYGCMITIDECRPVWFALLVCNEDDLRRLWIDPRFKRWWKLNGDMLGGMFRLAPDQMAVTHESPAP